MTSKHNSRSGLRFSLFVKMMGAFLLVVIVVTALTTTLTRRATEEEFNLYVTNANQRQAEVLAQSLAAYYGATGSWQGAESLLTAVPMPGNTRGRGMGQGQGMMGGSALSMMDSQTILAAPDGVVLVASNNDLAGSQLSADDLANGQVIAADGQPVGVVLVTSQEQGQQRSEQFLQQVARSTLIAAIVASGIALLLGGVLTWNMIRPLRQLTTAAEAIADGDLSQRVEVRANDEIGDLSLAFNAMTDRLDRSETLRRQMTADIAHELRTPLTVIQGNIEALQDGIFPLTLDALEPIESKTELLARLVEDLRQLALAEAGRLQLDIQPTDVVELARRTVQSFQPAADSKQIALTFEGEISEGLTAVDPQRIEQVLVNLLSNALRHTPQNGQITVTVQPNNQSAILFTIADSGAGIPPDALPYVFERFYRVDKGRSRESNEGGTGLGLAVARSIIEAHHGQIGVDSPPDEGAQFWFILNRVQ